MNILIVGSGAREHAIAKSFANSPSSPILFCCGTHNNPGIRKLTKQYWIGSIDNNDHIIKHAQDWVIDFAIVGPEAPLEKALVDALESVGIPCIGPKKVLAQLETSKSFTRELLKKYQIEGSPLYKIFNNMEGVEAYLKELGEEGYVIKADGLMGGKGVKVAGEHLHSFQEAYAFCQFLTQKHIPFIIEEKLIGQEFSLLCFSDGNTLIPMPIVQDHKRAYNQDKGPNTGGMGSYSDENHSLPFLKSEDILAAQKMNQAVIARLQETYNTPYKGIIYGSFIATAKGVYLIEYNVRFGDPEAINLLALLESDFTLVCQAIILGKLTKDTVRFKNLATVCKYAVPLGYPDEPLINTLFDISRVEDQNQLYFGATDKREGHLYATGSRTVAVLGIAPTIAEAEKIAETEISRIIGSLFHREDIGTQESIDKRIQMMNLLRKEEVHL